MAASTSAFRNPTSPPCTASSRGRGCRSKPIWSLAPVTDTAPGLTVGVRSLTYQGTTLFENLRFRLDGGSWTCLLGASGVGKTSLLRLIAGLAPGALVVADDGRGLDRRVALMAQQDLLLPWLPVVDNVILGYRLRG